MIDANDGVLRTQRNRAPQLAARLPGTRVATRSRHNRRVKVGLDFRGPGPKIRIPGQGKQRHQSWLSVINREQASGGYDGIKIFARWPGRWPAGETLNGIVAHEDWLPTFAAAAGNDKIVEQLKAGVELNGRTYRNYIDGKNMLDYLSGKVEESPRQSFIYVDDGGAVAAIRVGDWKAVYLENRADRLQIWKEPFVALRAPDLYNLRRDPFEKAKIGSNTYEDWYIDRAFLLGPMQVVASQFLMTLKDYPPSQAPGDWSLGSLERQIKGMTVGGQ